VGVVNTKLVTIRLLYKALPAENRPVGSIATIAASISSRFIVAFLAAPTISKTRAAAKEYALGYSSGGEWLDDSSFCVYDD
jgi:hypothetical protein